MNRIAQESGIQNKADEPEDESKKDKKKKKKKKDKKEKKKREDMSPTEILVEEKKDTMREIYDCLMFS